MRKKKVSKLPETRPIYKVVRLEVIKIKNGHAPNPLSDHHPDCKELIFYENLLITKRFPKFEISKHIIELSNGIYWGFPFLSSYYNE